MRVISPRRLWHSSMTVPVYSVGVMMVADSIGSSMWSMPAGVGQLGRVVDVELGPVGEEGPVLHARRGGDQREVELALEALADDLHVQQAEEAAAEADAQGVGGLGLEGEAGVVELELVEGVAQVGQLVAVDRVEPAEDHGLGVPVAGQRLGGAVLRAWSPSHPSGPRRRP